METILIIEDDRAMLRGLKDKLPKPPAIGF